MSVMAQPLSRPLRRWQVMLAFALALVAAAILAWQLVPEPTPRVVEHPMPVRTDIPAAVAAAPDGSIWFTVEFSDVIGVFRSGAIERLRKATANSEPLGLAIDSAGDAWFTDTVSRAISRMAPDGAVRSYGLPTPIVRLGRLAVAPDDAVWFADIATASVTRLKDGVFTQHDVEAEGGTPYGIGIAPDATVWTTLQGPDVLGRIAPDGRFSTVDVPTRNSGVGDLAVDAKGNVWFLELRANKIGRFADGQVTEFAVPTPSAGLTSLATAPDGSAWFTEVSAGRIGRIRDNAVTEFPLPHAGRRPFGITVDAANNVWYTDLSGFLGMLPADQAKAP